MRHAIMIMAHGDYDQLRNLVSLLDHEDIDIYIHINKLSADWKENVLEGATKHSQIIFVRRVPVTYCNYSQIEAQKSLLNSALKGQYNYYHILSGGDLPIHPITEILDFFKLNNGYEFVGVNRNYDVRRAGLKAFFSNKVRTSKGFVRKMYVKTSKILEKIQISCQVNFAKGFNGTPVKGSDWWSISDAAARYVLEQEPIFKRYFHRCYCPSELFVQTILLNSEFKTKIYNSDDETIGSCRKIDWTRGQPYVWRVADYEELVASPCMFARKFSQQIDSEIIKLISNHVKR